MMKKVIFILILVIISSIIGCKKHNTDIAHIGQSQTFETYYNEAIKSMDSLYGDYNYYFYEAWCTMSLSVNDRDFCDSSTIVGMKVLFQLKDTNTIVIFNYVDSVSIDTINNVIWKDDLPLHRDSIILTMEEASKLFSKTVKNKPIGHTVVLRKPNIDSLKQHAYFGFGSNNSFVFIDKDGNII